MEKPKNSTLQIEQDTAFNKENVVQSNETIKLNIENPELAPEVTLQEKLKSVDNELQKNTEKKSKVSAAIEGTKADLDKVREALGLSQSAKKTDEVIPEENTLEQLEKEKSDLEKQKRELLSQEEIERLIEEEKQKILQEKINELFKQFGGLNPEDFESIISSGKTAKNENVKSGSMGELSPESAQLFAKAFKEGLKFLPDILNKLPAIVESIKSFDKQIDDQAEKAVKEKLDKAKEKVEQTLKQNVSTPTTETIKEPGINIEGVNPKESFTVQSNETISINDQKSH